MKSPRDAVREVIEQLPETAFLEDLQYHLYVPQKVHKGLVAESALETIWRLQRPCFQDP